MAIKKYAVSLISAAAILLWMALALLGGPPNRFDFTVIQALAAERLAHPWLTHLGIWLSVAGSGSVTLPLTLFGAIYLVWRSRILHAAALIAIVLSGRLMVDYLKLWTGRPRPDLTFHAVTVNSLSFPSGHAANSMTAFVAIALFCAPQRHRRTALTIAIAASVLVGLSRPLLGVHWPSDVPAGWIFGLLWAVGWWRMLGASSLRLGTADAAWPLIGERRHTMTATPRDPAEQALIEDTENEPTPSQSGGSGDGMARDVGARDELARGTGKDTGVTRVHKGNKPDEGDEPNLPNR
jgi:membrane-associated phospholipid phosphatase